MTAPQRSEKPLKIGIIAPCPPPYGGIVRIIENNINFWSDENVESHWIPSYPPSEPGSIKGAEYHDLSESVAKSWKGLGAYAGVLARSPVTRPSIYRQFVNYNAALSALIIREKIDVLYAHELWPAGASAVMQSRIHGISSVVVAYGETWHTTPAYQRQHRIEPYVLKGANRIVSTSEHCRRGAITRGAPKDKASVIYAGIDLERFHPGMDGSSFRVKYDIEPEAVVISVLGLALRHKLDTMLDALEMMPLQGNIHCLIGGVGADLAYVKQRIAGISNVKVQLMGFVPEEDLPQFYAATDILVVSPRTLLECMGQSMKEAMASAKAVVGANIGGVPEAIEDGVNGLMYEPDNPEDLVRALSHLCANPALRKQMGDKGRQFAEERFNARTSAKMTLELLELSLSG